MKHARDLHYAIEYAAVADLRAYARNARRHSKKQIQPITDSIRRFGFTNPVLVGDDLEIIAGHGRVAAARQLIEYDPLYCDTIVRRYQAYTGKSATLADSELAFDDIAMGREAADV